MMTVVVAVLAALGAWVMVEAAVCRGRCTLEQVFSIISHHTLLFSRFICSSYFHPQFDSTNMFILSHQSISFFAFISSVRRYPIPSNPPTYSTMVLLPFKDDFFSTSYSRSEVHQSNPSHPTQMVLSDFFLPGLLLPIPLVCAPAKRVDDGFPSHPRLSRLSPSCLSGEGGNLKLLMLSLPDLCGKQVLGCPAPPPSALGHAGVDAAQRKSDPDRNVGRG